MSVAIILTAPKITVLHFTTEDFDLQKCLMISYKKKHIDICIHRHSLSEWTLVDRHMYETEKRKKKRSKVASRLI
jgi:hypothetical protein